MKLWICVVGGEESENYDEERVIAKGGIEEIDAGIDKYSDEVADSTDKYFWVESDHDEWTIEDVDQYYDSVREEIVQATSLARVLGRMLLPQNFGRR